jgi:hypothetical protein
MRTITGLIGRDARVESPPLFIAHRVQQANVNPQALADLLADSSKERVVNQQRIREMRHTAGVKDLDFTPVMIVALASVVGAHYLAIGTGDTERYIFAGMRAAVMISLRVFLFKGAGKANEPTGTSCNNTAGLRLQWLTGMFWCSPVPQTACRLYC